MKMTPILFMGTPRFAATALQGLLDAGFNVIGVITQPDAKSGRGGILITPEAKVVANEHKIPVFQPTDKQGLVDVVNKIQPELIVVAAYGMIVPQAVLDIPKYGALNIHGSLLPKYRGASPITEAILNGDTETGITIMKMTLGMDEGAIISQYKLPILSPVIPSERIEPRNRLGAITEGSLQQGRDDNEEYDTTESLTTKMAELGSKAIAETIPGWINGELKATEQDGSQASYCKKISKEDGHIDWNKSATEIECMIRAYTPWPSAYSELFGKNVKITHASISDIKLNPGETLIENKRLFIGTGTTALEITEIQPESKKPMSATDFINGLRINY